MSGIVSSIQELKEEVRNNRNAIKEMEEKLDGVLSTRVPDQAASTSGIKVPVGLSVSQQGILFCRGLLI